MQGGPGNPGVDIRGQRALEITIDLAQEAADAFTRHLNADPLNWPTKKTLMPFICWRKEVVGMLYRCLLILRRLSSSTWVSLKRRDTSDYFKDTYGMVIKNSSRRNDGKRARPITGAQKSDSAEVPLENSSSARRSEKATKNPQTIAIKLADRIERATGQ
jgi:hypothetical protein